MRTLQFSETYFEKDCLESDFFCQEKKVMKYFTFRSKLKFVYLN